MNDRLLYVLAFAIYLGVAILVPGDGPLAVFLCAVLSIAAGFVIGRIGDDRRFLLRLFISALIVRVLLGALIFTFGLQDFFGGDAITYDYLGGLTLDYWRGDTYYEARLARFSAGGGWGMTYMVAAVYGVIGRNMLAVQFVNAVLGAATAPVIYLCAHRLFGNRRAARLAAGLVAFYPSLVLWSSQGLKDGPIIFLLALAMLATLRLGDGFSMKFLLMLICALFGIFSLRFYVFYMLLAAVSGAFLVGLRAVTTQSLIRQFVLIIGIGLALTYLGVLRTAGAQFERFGTLESVQNSRSDQAQSAASGFGQDADVSTAGGALSAIPLGLAYLLFAPFPWQMANLRQSITLPEMLVWWASVPLLALGLWFTIKYRLRQAQPILLFTTMLTLAYSVFQGNVGTAYRQRAQLLIFYFIFVAVGYVLVREKAEERRLRSRALIDAERALRSGRRGSDAPRPQEVN